MLDLSLSHFFDFRKRRSSPRQSLLLFEGQSTVSSPSYGLGLAPIKDVPRPLGTLIAHSDALAEIVTVLANPFLEALPIEELPTVESSHQLCSLEG